VNYRANTVELQWWKFYKDAAYKGDVTLVLEMIDQSRAGTDRRADP
jgi:hypothetical protein